MKGYISFVLQNAPRLLSNVDRRRRSPTFGCADRNYWHYKIVDFPCAMLQETCLTLAQLYSIKFPGNIYYARGIIRELALAAMAYWGNIQKRDGSFDEFFPNEHSFSPTAFTLYAVCMACHILRLDDSRIINQTRKSAQFLLEYGDCGAANQRVAAIAGIYAYHLISDDQSVLKGLDGLIMSVLESQSSEGWMPEYQGPDIGYQSVALGYMTDYYRLSGDERIKGAVNSMIDFLSYFVHPDGSVGGEYGSRNTSYLAPHGFELNGKTNPLAKSIAEEVFLNPNSTVNIALDDRYICHFILPSYLASIQYYTPSRVTMTLPHQKIFEKYFDECRIFVKSTKAYYFVCNLQKGGCFKIIAKQGDSVSDTGYVVSQGKTLAINNWIDFRNTVIINEDSLNVEGVFHEMINRVPTTFWHSALRFATLMFRKKVLVFLKEQFILRDKPIAVGFERTIKYSDFDLRIVDRIASNNGKVFDLWEADSLTYRYVAPTNYFSREELTDLNSRRGFVGKNLTCVRTEKRIKTNPLGVFKANESY